MSYIKALLWRVVYVAVLAVILFFIVPLLFALICFTLPSSSGPAIQLIKFAVACLILIYVFFGPPPPALF